MTQTSYDFLHWISSWHSAKNFNLSGYFLLKPSLFLLEQSNCYLKSGFESCTTIFFSFVLNFSQKSSLFSPLLLCLFLFSSEFYWIANFIMFSQNCSICWKNSWFPLLSFFLKFTHLWWDSLFFSYWTLPLKWCCEIPHFFLLTSPSKIVLWNSPIFSYWTLPLKSCCEIAQFFLWTLPLKSCCKIPHFFLTELSL